MRKMMMAALAAAMAFAQPALAAYTVTFAQVGSDVVATGMGTLNITGLNKSGDNNSGQINPSRGWVLVGSGAADTYITNVSFSGFLGTGGNTIATSAVGGLTGIYGTFNVIDVPVGYVSGSFTTSSLTFANSTFQSLGLTGSATATFNSGVNADTFSIVVPSLTTPAVPEPASWAMMTIGFGLLGAAMRRRNVKVSFA